MTYNQWRDENPKNHFPLQESEEDIWRIAQDTLLNEIKKLKKARVINGTLSSVILSESLDGLLDETN